MIVLAHAHKPDFEPLLRIYFELYFLLFFFPLPFVLVLLSTLYGDRKALSVFFLEKKRLIFNVAKFPLVSIFICLSLFQGLPTDGFLLNSLKTPFLVYVPRVLLDF